MVPLRSALATQMIITIHYCLENHMYCGHCVKQFSIYHCIFNPHVCLDTVVLSFFFLFLLNKKIEDEEGKLSWPEAHDWEAVAVAFKLRLVWFQNLHSLPPRPFVFLTWMGRGKWKAPPASCLLFSPRPVGESGGQEFFRKNFSSVIFYKSRPDIFPLSPTAFQQGFGVGPINSINFLLVSIAFLVVVSIFLALA